MRATLIPLALALGLLMGCQSGRDANQRRIERQLHHLERQLQGLTDDQRLSAAERQRRMDQLGREIHRLLETLARSVEAEIKSDPGTDDRK